MDISEVRSSEIPPAENDTRCAPTKDFSNGSCIELDVLHELARAYNEEHPNKKIKLSSSLNTLKPDKYKRHLVKELKLRLDSICDDQMCWIKQPFVKRMKKVARESLVSDTLRPQGPGAQGNFTWLNTINIDQVMKQYENKYKDFKFLGAVPIDFEELPYLEIQGVSFDKLQKKGKNRIGVVFNLDEHNKSGSHWVASYIDLNKGQVYFFDSYGIRPEKRISEFMNKAKKYIDGQNKYSNKYDTSAIVKHNDKRHQYKNSECGVYSINFITRMLQGDSFEKIINDRTPDNKINKCREVYFTNE